MVRHGHAPRVRKPSPTYSIWKGMLQRTTNPKAHAYADYGGRGIGVIPEWHRFEQFLADMGERPPGHSLDRISPDGGYCPANCRWATPKQQAETTRSVMRQRIFPKARGLLSLLGHTLTEWARQLRIKRADLKQRILSGESICDVLETLKREGVLKEVGQ